MDLVKQLEILELFLQRIEEDTVFFGFFYKFMIKAVLPHAADPDHAE